MATQKESSTHSIAPRRIRNLRERLLTWYREHRRDLPWRRTSDPYAILVSEIMLQQTRVDTVIPYYENFLERFPDATSLATSDTEDVLRSWAGLGYYSRARNLQRAAQHVRDRCAGRFPESAEGLRELPGVGPYTAGALASIAFDQPAAIVDGNVVRVLCRLFGIREDAKQRATLNRLWELAGAFARGPSPGDLNQGLMELGALVCTPKSPRCGECPWCRSCDARRKGDAESLPIAAIKRPSPIVHAVGVLATRGTKALFVRRAARELLGGHWELPGSLCGATAAPVAVARRALREDFGLDLQRARNLGQVRHVFSHRKLQLNIVCGRVVGRMRRGSGENSCWLSPWRMAEQPPTALTRKVLDCALRNENGASGKR